MIQPPRWLLAAAWAGALLPSVAFLATKLWTTFRSGIPEQIDMNAYYFGGQVVRLAPELVYDRLRWSEVLSHPKAAVDGGYYYLPQLLQWYGPISALSLEQAQIAWLLVNVCCAAGLLAMVVRAAPGRAGLAGAALLVAAPPLIDNIAIGQVNLAIAVLSTGGALALVHWGARGAVVGGALIGFALVLKPIAFAAVAATLAPRRLAAGLAGLALGLALGLAPGASLPPAVVGEAIGAMAGIGAAGATPGFDTRWNQSLYGLADKLSAQMPLGATFLGSALPDLQPRPLLPRWASVALAGALWIAVAAATGLAATRLWRSRHARRISAAETGHGALAPADAVEQLGIVMLGALLLLPLSWWLYLPLAALAFVPLGRAAVSGGWPSLLVAIGLGLVVAQRAAAPIAGATGVLAVYSLQCSGMLLWLAVAVAGARGASRPESHRDDAPTSPGLSSAR